MADIVIASAARTPVASFNGAFATLPAHELGAIAIGEALKRAKVEPGQVTEVVLGQILTAGADGTARLWDRSTGQLRQTYEGSARFLTDATLVSNDLVVAGGADGFLRFWDTSNGRLLWMLQAHRSYVIGVHYEGSDLVTRGFAGDLARWALPPPDRIIEACQASACASMATAGG